MDISSLTSSITGQIDQANASREAGNLERAMNSATSDDAGKRFEAMLGTMLAKEMRKGLDEGFFGKGPGADSFSSWLDEYVGRTMAEQGTLGTGSLVKQYVSEVEGAAQAQAVNELEGAEASTTRTYQPLDSEQYSPLLESGFAPLEGEGFQSLEPKS